MAADFEQAIRNGAALGDLAMENLAEARAALALTLGAQESGRQGSIQVKVR